MRCSERVNPRQKWEKLRRGNISQEPQGKRAVKAVEIRGETRLDKSRTGLSLNIVSGEQGTSPTGGKEQSSRC
jgi:hypothetical protein